MSKDKAKELAVDIVKMLRYNPNLTEDQKELAIQIRVQKAFEEIKDDRVQVSDFTGIFDVNIENFKGN